MRIRLVNTLSGPPRTGHPDGIRGNPGEIRDIEATFAQHLLATGNAVPVADGDKDEDWQSGAGLNKQAMARQAFEKSQRDARKSFKI